MNGTTTFPFTPALRLALLGAALVALPRAGQAQRHIERMQAVSVQVGQTEQIGRFLYASYGRFLSNRTRFDVRTTAEWGVANSPIGKFSAYGVGLGLSRTLFRLGEVVYVHGTLAVNNRYERTQEDGTGSSDFGRTPQKYVVGPLVGADADVYLANRVSLCGSVSKGYLFLGSNLSNWPGNYAVGLRYHFR